MALQKGVGMTNAFAASRIDVIYLTYTGYDVNTYKVIG